MKLKTEQEKQKMVFSLRINNMKQKANSFKTIVIGILAMALIVILMNKLIPLKSKYIVYAHENKYYCNKFTVTGNTIYFTDVYGKNVIINGQYTLIFEEDEK